MAESCFHCGEPIPTGTRLSVRVEGSEQPVCCIGCQHAAQWIVDARLSDYYRLREDPAPQPEAELGDYAQWDEPALTALYVHTRPDGRAEVSVLLEGIRCAACVWLIERALRGVDGLEQASVNSASHRARLVWDPGKVKLSSLLARLARLGYRPHPASADQRQALHKAEQRAALKRLLVAGFGMMQAMMYAVALYAGAFTTMDDAVRDFFRWLGFLVATPVVFYAGAPILLGARDALRQRRLSMDVPVALAISLAYAASLVEILKAGPEVYFDSVTMFVFLLSLGRYVEMRARHRSADAIDALARLQPAVARRLDGELERLVPVHALRSGDRVRVRAGEAFPADGRVLGEPCLVDESLLSGESEPLLRRAGETVLAGSLCVDRPAQVLVERVGSDTALAATVRLVEQAQACKPKVAELAERAAGRFIARVLVFTVVTAGFWLWYQPEKAFSITLAVLVVTCPCALSLSVPTALAAVLARLARLGVLVVRSDAIEALAKADRIIFDKTGTLTHGWVSVEQVEVFAAISRDEALAIAAALESGSRHPIAQAFAEWGGRHSAQGVTVVPGAGVSGHIDGQAFRLGRAGYADAIDGVEADVWLSGPDGPLAGFRLRDSLRPEAATVVATLKARGLEPIIVSGDREGRVREAAERLGITKWVASQRPDDKLALLRELQTQGHVVAMVGDGINDAPVLAAADVSVSLSSAAEVAQASADVVLTGDRIDRLPQCLELATFGRRLMRQNLGWSLFYNLSAMPFAAAGFVPPWLAAIGMSASSLVVTLNATRANRWTPADTAPRPRAALTARMAGEAGR